VLYVAGADSTTVHRPPPDCRDGSARNACGGPFSGRSYALVSVVPPLQELANASFRHPARAGLRGRDFCLCQSAASLAAATKAFVSVDAPVIVLTHVQVVDGTGAAPALDQPS